MAVNKPRQEFTLFSHIRKRTTINISELFLNDIHLLNINNLKNVLFCWHLTPSIFKMCARSKCQHLCKCLNATACKIIQEIWDNAHETRESL